MDPFAGSYVVESLTDDLEAEVLRQMSEVAERGGAVAAIEEGYQKTEIERSAYEIAGQIDNGERVVVGVNRFRIDGEEDYVPLVPDPAIEQAQGERLRRLRAERDGAAVDKCLGELRGVAAGTGNVLPVLKRALATRATIGEVCDALRDVWGTYTPTERF